MIYYINIHTHRFQSTDISIFNIPFNDDLNDAKYLSYGVHPWDIEKIKVDEQLERLKKFCDEKKIVAVGEIGLDRAIQTSFDIQMDVFQKQIEIAKHYKLPVIIHCVKAWSDILSIRKSRKYSNPWIFHGFTGNLEIAKKNIKEGGYLSFGKALIENVKLQEVFKKLQPENIFFETDDSDYKIEEIYQKASEIYDICIDELKTIICTNFNKVFGLSCMKTG